MSTTDEIVVRVLGVLDSRNRCLVYQLTERINTVYEAAESGLWRAQTTRTTGPELAELIAARQIAVATWRGHITGSVRIRDASPRIAEFGMLVSDPDHRGVGVGRALVEFAERDSRDRGLRAIQLELLVPRLWRHPGKEFLKAWYSRRGYRVIGTRSVDDAHPHLAPMLATPCDLVVYEKPLRVRRLTN